MSLCWMVLFKKLILPLGVFSEHKASNHATTHFYFEQREKSKSYLSWCLLLQKSNGIFLYLYCDIKILTIMNYGANKY